MLIYEYPNKLDRRQKQAKAVHDLKEHTKMRRNMYKNIILGAVIIGISFVVKAVLIKILMILIGVGNMAVAFLLYNFYALSRDADVYTRIYDDRLEHSQRVGFSKKYLHIILFYEDIEKSSQSNLGRLCCVLKNNGNSTFFIEDEKGLKSDFFPKDNCISLAFQDTTAKLKLVNEMYEQIKYPHKEYKEIKDDDDYYTEEDLKWDKLHKHGL